MKSAAARLGLVVVCLFVVAHAGAQILVPLQPNETTLRVMAPGPTGLTAKLSPTSIQLRWTCPANATGYDVFATPRGGAQVKLTPTPLGPQCLQDLAALIQFNDPRLPAPTASTTYSSGYTHGGLASGMEFTYVVRALYSNTFGDSVPLIAQIPWLAPSGLTATVAERSVNLKWNPIAGPLGYVVSRKLQSQPLYQAITPSPIAAASFKDTPPTGEYDYIVQAVNGQPSASVKAITGVGPDLVITQVATAPAVPTYGLPFKVQVQVRNQGNTRATIQYEPRLHLVMHHKVVSAGAHGDPLYTWQYESEVRIEPGQSETFTIHPTLAGSQIGTTTWTVKVDEDNAVLELDESNNQIAYALTIPALTGTPDLVARGCSFSPAEPTVNEQIQVLFDSANTGTGGAWIPVGANMFVITWKPEAPRLESITIGGSGYTVPPVPIGTPSLRAHYIKPNSMPAGTYTAMATLDPDNLVAESNETNNSTTCTLTIRP